jgi:SAM-dependent methyltransferase
MAFKDHFSRQAADYRRYRPTYPAALIDFVAGCCADRTVAVDCATGSGQAAVALAERFASVIAVDGSPGQLARAEPHARVGYAAALAEQLPVRAGSVDLVAVAQAAHWFDHDRFHAECRRVLAPGGVVAAWCYEKFRVEPAIDAVVDDFYSNVIGADWPPERRYVAEGYRSLPFPWREEPAPPFEIEVDWDLAQLMGYLATWSAVQRCRDRTGQDPLAALQPRLAQFWPQAGRKRVCWPVHLRLGRA